MHAFLHFGIHEYASTIAHNALILQLLGASPQIHSGGSAPCTPLGAQPADPLSPSSTIFWIRHCLKKGKGSSYSITECRVPELILVLGSQPAGGVSHKPGGRRPLLFARPAVTPATIKRAATNFAAW